MALAALARERGGVDTDRHGDGRVVDRDERQRARVVRVREGLTDRDVGDARDGDDVARASLLGRDAVERLRLEELGDAHVLDRAVVASPRDRLALADRAVEHAQEREAAEERRGVEVGDVRLQRRGLVVRRCGDLLEDRAEQRLEVLAVREAAVGRLLEPRAASLRGGVDDGDVEDRVEVEVRDVLVEVGRETEQEVGRLGDDLGDARVGTVDLVDDDDHRELRGERLAQHEACLGQRPLGRVDEEYDAVDHRQAALDLTTEVGVARGVDDVDRDAVGLAERRRGRTGVPDRRVLGEDRDALLTLEVTGVHRALVDVGVGTESTGLVQHRVDEGGLPVVDVSHDGHVAQVRAHRHRGTHFSGG